MSKDSIRQKFIRKVPQKIINQICKDMEEYSLCFTDALNLAFREYQAGTESEIYKAWYYQDFRAFCPSIYNLEYLDFEKYPLKYTV